MARFKKCENCGHVNLSKLEARIIKTMPSTSKDTAKKFKIPRNQALVVLTRLKKLGVIKQNGSNKNRTIIFTLSNTTIHPGESL